MATPSNAWRSNAQPSKAGEAKHSNAMKPPRGPSAVSAFWRVPAKSDEALPDRSIPKDLLAAFGASLDRPALQQLLADVRGLMERSRLRVCAVRRRRFPVVASPIRQPLQPEATEVVM